MIEVGVSEAKTRLSALLGKVARGEEVSITRRGAPVARLVPAERSERARTGNAIAELRALRKKLRSSGLDWKALRDDGAHAPSVWRLELGNALAQAERRERISSARVAAYLDIVDRLPIITDMETESRAFREILALARRLGLIPVQLQTYTCVYFPSFPRRRESLFYLDLLCVDRDSRLRGNDEVKSP